mgnify:CR=1 FL=1
MIGSIYLVARRDYLGYVTAWGFWLGLLLTPVLLGAGMIAPTLAASSEPVRHFTVIDGNDAFRDALMEEMSEARADAVRFQIETLELVGSGTGPGALEAFNAALEGGASLEDAISATGQESTLSVPQRDYAYVPPPAGSLEQLRPWLLGERQIETEAGPAPLFAVLVVKPDRIEYWSENVTEGGLKSLARDAATRLARARVFAQAGVDPGILERISAATPELEEKRVRDQAGAPSEVTLADRAPFIVSIAIAFLLWTLIFSVVNYLLMGTIEERSNKIFDSLLTSVSLSHLLAGKLIAVLAVSLTLMAVWGLGGTAVTVLVGAALPSGAAGMIETFAAAALNPAILLPALLSFLLGYLMFGALFLALGSLCDTIQEAQTLMTPLLVLLMVPLFMLVIAIENPESPIIGVMSWIPVFTPFLLILRMPTEPALWEVAALLVLMAAAAMVILWLATRVYRAGAVHGAGVNDALAWMKNRLPGLGKPAP